MHTLGLNVVVLLALVCATPSCGTGTAQTPVKSQRGIVAGPNERTFAERYHLNISLPMPEQQFLALLNRLKLSYEVVGERGTATDVLVPLHKRNLDLTKIKRSYQIYGDVGRIGKKYRAYVDTNNQVVYVENAFSYPPL